MPAIPMVSRLRGFADEYPAIWQNWVKDFVANIFAGVYQGCIWSFALQIARGHGATGLQMGLMSAAPATGYLFALFWARQMEGRSKLPFVWGTWLVSRGIFVLAPFIIRGAGARTSLVFLLCACPIMFSVSMPAYTAIMRDIYPDRQRARLMSLVRIGTMLTTIITARVMGSLQQYHGLDYRWMFFVGALFGVGTSVVFRLIRLPNVTVASPTPPPLSIFISETFSILRHNRGFRWFCVSVFISGFANLIQMPAEIIIQVDRFHITPIQIATMANLANLFAMLSLFGWGWFMDRYGALSGVLVTVLLNCLVPLIYAFAPSMRWLYVANIALGVSGTGMDLAYLTAIITFSNVDGRTSQYQAVHSFLFGIRGTLAPLLTFPLAGILGDRWTPFFLASALLMFIGFICQYVSLRTYRIGKSATG